VFPRSQTQGTHGAQHATLVHRVSSPHAGENPTSPARANPRHASVESLPEARS
jgi:hypothetical protein